MKGNRPGEKVKLLSVDQLLGVPDGELAEDIEISKIHSFKNHPFKVVDDEKMKELTESIKNNGVLSPVLVRPCVDGSYEMISGHRRLHAATKVGLITIPCIVREMTDEAATIAMVDSNLQRELILPSEKAFAYKMRYEAMKKQGYRRDLSSSQNETKFGTNQSRSDNDLAEQVGESRNQIHRYIRLTELIPELLDMVDSERLPMTIGVDISYFPLEIQKWTLEYIKENGVIKGCQIAAVKQCIGNGIGFTQDSFIEIMNENMPGRIPTKKVTISNKKLNEFFPSYYTNKQMEEVIYKLLAQWSQQQSV